MTVTEQTGPLYLNVMILISPSTPASPNNEDLEACSFIYIYFYKDKSKNSYYNLIHALNKASSDIKI